MKKKIAVIIMNISERFDELLHLKRMPLLFELNWD